jgi:hypothetical protein
MKDTYKSFIVPPGKYWLDDPCVVLASIDDWCAYCEICDSEDMATEEYKELLKSSIDAAMNYRLSGHYVSLPDGTKVLSFSTACGDGWYSDQSGTRYHVASGVLGLTPYEYSPDHELLDGGKLVEFSEDTLCFTRDGILTFGNNIIDTVSNCTHSDGMEL